MKKIVTMSLVALALPLGMQAQDDLYFVPTKANVDKSADMMGMPRDTYYSGSRRSIDDYNRRRSSLVQPLDSAGNDIIDFDGRMGVYPDSTTAIEQPDYQYTRRMSKFDDYQWRESESYRAGYRAGRASSWYWDDPFYWDYPYYGYYSSWYWDYPYYGGWYHPWYYSSWYYPYRPYYGVVWGGGHPYGSGYNRRHFSSSDFGGARFGGNSNSSSTRMSNARFGGQRSSTRSSSRSYSFSSPSNSSFNSSPSSTSGSFGGARSGGSFSGSSSGGGRSGGISFGGRR